MPIWYVVIILVMIPVVFGIMLDTVSTFLSDRQKREERWRKLQDENKKLRIENNRMRELVVLPPDDEG